MLDISSSDSEASPETTIAFKSIFREKDGVCYGIFNNRIFVIGYLK